MYDEKKQKEAQRREWRTMLLLALEGLGLIVAAFAISFIAGGCGEHRDRVAATSPAGNQPVTATAVAATPSAPLTGPQENDPVVDVDSLPPEVSASVQDTLVTPGAAVEITAEASIDATELVLWDGIGRRQSFVYDVQGKVWRTYYRVPMKSANRLALSVTAKAQSGRWRRVWVFLDVQRPSDAVQEPQPQPSPTSQP